MNMLVGAQSWVDEPRETVIHTDGDKDVAVRLGKRKSRYSYCLRLVLGISWLPICLPSLIFHNTT